MVRDTSSASVLSEPPAMASRRVTIAPPDGSGGGASAGGGGDDGVGALPATTYNERDPSLRKDSGKLRRMSVQTGGFSAPKAPAIPAKERLAKLMVVSPEVLRELSGGALTPATLVAEPKHLVSVAQARERSLRATATNIDSLDIVRRLWRALDLCEREAEEGELNDAAAAAAAATAASSALSEGSASAAAVTPLSGSRAKSSPASNGSTPKASPASSTAGTPKASMSASMSESKSEGVRWAGGGDPSRFLWPLRQRLRQLDDEEAPFESERRRKRREASDVVAARAALMRAHEIHLDSISTPQRDGARAAADARAHPQAPRAARVAALLDEHASEFGSHASAAVIDDQLAAFHIWISDTVAEWAGAHACLEDEGDEAAPQFEGGLCALTAAREEAQQHDALERGGADLAHHLHKLLPLRGRCGGPASRVKEVAERRACRVARAAGQGREPGRLERALCERRHARLERQRVHCLARAAAAAAGRVATAAEEGGREADAEGDAENRCGEAAGGRAGGVHAEAGGERPGVRGVPAVVQGEVV